MYLNGCTLCDEKLCHHKPLELVLILSARASSMQLVYNTSDSRLYSDHVGKTPHAHYNGNI